MYDRGAERASWQASKPGKLASCSYYMLFFDHHPALRIIIYYYALNKQHSLLLHHSFHMYNIYLFTLIMQSFLVVMKRSFSF